MKCRPIFSEKWKKKKPKKKKKKTKKNPQKTELITFRVKDRKQWVVPNEQDYE